MTFSILQFFIQGLPETLPSIRANTNVYPVNLYNVPDPNNLNDATNERMESGSDGPKLNFVSVDMVRFSQYQKYTKKYQYFSFKDLRRFF